MTVEEVLRQSGFTDDQIRSLEPRAITAFNGVISAAEQERQAAELAQRSNRDFYESQIAPALTTWDEERTRLDNERVRMEAEVAFYKTQNEAARANGFVPANAPTPRDGQGRYVANTPGSTPGSPTFDVNQVYQRAGDAVSVLTDIQWEHQRLFNQPLPISPSELVKRADAVKLDPQTYAARTFGWDQKRQELEKQAKESERATIVKEVEARKDREWSERVGSNPDMRRPMESRFGDVAKAVRAGTLPDPLALNETERRTATRQAIRTELAERQD